MSRSHTETHETETAPFPYSDSDLYMDINGRIIVFAFPNMDSFSEDERRVAFAAGLQYDMLRAAQTVERKALADGKTDEEIREQLTAFCNGGYKPNVDRRFASIERKRATLGEEHLEAVASKVLIDTYTAAKGVAPSDDDVKKSWKAFSEHAKHKPNVDAALAAVVDPLLTDWINTYVAPEKKEGAAKTPKTTKAAMDFDSL